MTTNKNPARSCLKVVICTDTRRTVHSLSHPDGWEERRYIGAIPIKVKVDWPPVRLQAESRAKFPHQSIDDNSISAPGSALKTGEAESTAQGAELDGWWP